MAEIYLDLNSMTPTDNLLVSGLDVAKQQLRNLFLSKPKGVRPFNPEFGIDLEDYLFELYNPEDELSIFNEINIKVQRYVPSVEVNWSKTEVVADPDNHQYKIFMYFSLVEDFNINEKDGSDKTYLLKGTITK